jgi:hypothetical protein
VRACVVYGSQCRQISACTVIHTLCASVGTIKDFDGFLQIYVVIAFCLEIKEGRGGGVATCGQIRVGMTTCN